MENGDFVELEYTGRVQATGEIFSTTDEVTAKKNNIFNERTQYGSIIAVIGQQFLLSGLDKQLINLKVGETKTLEVSTQEAYGKRNGELIESFSIRRLRKSGIKPVVGEKFKNQNRFGTIISLKEGRARVDFNHPLAGKNLEFEVTIREVITDRNKQIGAIIRKYIPTTKPEELKFEINSADDKDVSIELNPFLLLTQGAGEMMIRMLGDFRDQLGFQKIEYKFPFDFSGVKTAEKELKEVVADVSSETESETESEIETIDTKKKKAKAPAKKKKAKAPVKKKKAKAPAKKKKAIKK